MVRPAWAHSLLVEYFRDDATIMVVTEAAAESINLQFCPLVINYDLPWNPQRIERTRPGNPMVDGSESPEIGYFAILAAQATGVSSARDLMERSARPGSTSSRYWRIGIFSLR
jgi:hypothetical protein